MKYLVLSRPVETTWAHRSNVAPFDKHFRHFPPSLLSSLTPKDEVYGLLPVNLIAEICLRGARYYQMVVPLDADRRSLLTSDDFEAVGTKWQRYNAAPIDDLVSRTSLSLPHHIPLFPLR